MKVSTRRSSRGNAMSVVRTSSADFETTLMKRLQAFELTAQQDHQVNNFVEPASEAMRRVLNVAVAERS